MKAEKDIVVNEGTFLQEMEVESLGKEDNNEEESPY